MESYRIRRYYTSHLGFKSSTKGLTLHLLQSSFVVEETSSIKKIFFDAWIAGPFKHTDIRRTCYEVRHGDRHADGHAKVDNTDK